MPAYTAAFRAWLGDCLDHEGRTLENVSGDPGGLTFWGVDQASWGDTRKRCPAELQARLPWSVGDLTPDLVTEVYWYAYYLHSHADQLPPSIGCILANIAVNGGLPVWWLQGALSSKGVTLDVDGVMGPQTIAAATAFPDRAKLLAGIQAFHLAYLTSLPTWAQFGASDGKPHGWAVRLFEEMAQCLAYDQIAEAAPVAPATFPAGST